MPRPPIRRRVCRYTLPAVKRFYPEDDVSTPEIILTIDEYEVIRLLDNENLTQQECAQRMGVARTSVQSIYETARKKLADFLVNGKQLKIEGGSCIICDGRHFCGSVCKFISS